MITISIDLIILSIGHFALRWYSLIVMTAIATGVWLAAREAGREGFEIDQPGRAPRWLAVAGISHAAVSSRS